MVDPPSHRHRGRCHVVTTRRVTRRRLAALGSAGPVAATPTRRSLPALVGRALAGLLTRVGLVDPAPPDLDTDRTRGVAALIAVGCAVVSPLAGVVVAVGGWHLPRLLAARSAGSARRALDDEVFLAVQLCAVSVHAGTTVAQTIAVVAPHLSGRLGAALRAVGRGHRSGALLDEELAAVATDLGAAVAPLIGILRAAHTDGDPVEPALVRLGDRLRDERRRATEAEVRRLSVRLLLPLVCCSLPGFVLIAVVPLGIEALGGLTG